jgi:hypothetical protein
MQITIIFYFFLFYFIVIKYIFFNFKPINEYKKKLINSYYSSKNNYFKQVPNSYSKLANNLVSMEEILSKIQN